MTSRLDLKSTKLALGFVLISTALIYISCLRYEFTYDDNSQIVINSAITTASHIPEYFTTHVWARIAPEAANYYRPVFLLWLLLNYKLFGLSPFGWHATSLLVHLVATWLVFVLAKRLTANHWLATVAAFLFGIHPVHIESVAWISGVTDPLMTVFFISAFLLFLDSHRGSKNGDDAPQALRQILFNRSFLLSLFFYTLAILSKETAVVFVFIIFCHELLMGKARSQDGPARRSASIILTLLPYLIVTGVYFIVRTRVLGGIGHQLTPLPATTIALTIPSVLWFYVSHLIWPFPISAFYDTFYVAGGRLFWAPLAGLLALAIVYIYLTRRSALHLFLLAWVLLPILPLLNLSIFKWGEIVHDRYLYLPSVAFCIILSAALTHVIANYPKYKVAAAALLVVIAGGWLLETIIELPQWKNDLALYSHGVAVAPDNSIAVNNLATVLKFQGDLDRAVGLYKQVLAREPNNWLSLYNLGHAYYKLGALDEADQCLSRAIALNPRAPEQYLFYGLTAMGRHDVQTAETAFRTAVGLRPANATYHFALGVVLKQKGDLVGARMELNRSVELDQTMETNARPLLQEIDLNLPKQGLN